MFRSQFIVKEDYVCLSPMADFWVFPRGARECTGTNGNHWPPAHSPEFRIKSCDKRGATVVNASRGRLGWPISRMAGPSGAECPVVPPPLCAPHIHWAEQIGTLPPPNTLRSFGSRVSFTLAVLRLKWGGRHMRIPPSFSSACVPRVSRFAAFCPGSSGRKSACGTGLLLTPHSQGARVAAYRAKVPLPTEHSTLVLSRLVKRGLVVKAAKRLRLPLGCVCRTKPAWMAPIALSQRHRTESSQWRQGIVQ